MIDYNLYFAFIITAIIVVSTPGPAVLFIVARSINLGVRGGLLSALGISLGAVCHAIAVSLGLAQLLSSSPEYFVIVKNLGCIYLIYMGIKTFTSKTDNDTNEEKDDKQRKNVTIQGFWVELLNPKSALFFLAFLPQFTNKSLGNVDTQLIILSLTVIVLGFISDAMYALMAGHIGNSLKKSSHFRRIEKYLSGSIFCSLGILGLCYKLAKK